MILFKGKFYLKISLKKEDIKGTNMDKYLIALDLDGTTISGLYNISEYAVNVLRKLKEKGHKIVICTGRPFRSSYFVHYKAKLDTPIINYNGQMITDPRTDIRYRNDRVKRETILDIYNHEKDNFTLFFSEVYDTIHANMVDDDVLPLMHHNSLSSLIVGDLNEILKDDAHGTLILAKKGKSKEIMDYATSHAGVGARCWGWGGHDEIVELFSLNSNKAIALNIVKEKLGFDDEHTLICGDSINDFEFLKAGGKSVVPSNADPRIKELSDIVLEKSVFDDAVPHYLAEFFGV